MTNDDDYERLSIWINKFDQEKRIRTEHQGRNWDELTRKEKQTTLQDLLYKGFYPDAAEKLSKGIDYIRGNQDEFFEGKIKNRKIIRDKKGRIFRWL